MVDWYRKWLRSRYERRERGTVRDISIESAIAYQRDEMDRKMAEIDREKVECNECAKMLEEHWINDLAQPVAPMTEDGAYEQGYKDGFARMDYEPGKYDRSIYRQGYEDGKGDRRSKLEAAIGEKLFDENEVIQLKKRGWKFS